MVPENIQHHIDELLREAASYREQAEACAEAARVLEHRFGANGSAPTTASVTPPPKPSPLASWTPPGPFRRNTRTTKGKQPKTRAEWIVHVLKEAGKPLRVGDIVDGIIAAGQGNGLKRNILYNSTATAIGRKPDKFRREEDGSWSLIDSEDSESDGKK